MNVKFVAMSCTKVHGYFLHFVKLCEIGLPSVHDRPWIVTESLFMATKPTSWKMEISKFLWQSRKFDIRSHVVTIDAHGGVKHRIPQAYFKRLVSQNAIKPWKLWHPKDFWQKPELPPWIFNPCVYLWLWLNTKGSLRMFSWMIKFLLIEICDWNF
jgi:hypothetical protein